MGINSNVQISKAPLWLRERSLLTEREKRCTEVV